MGPQIENGYTRIANELLEVLSQLNLNGTQYKILLVVFRYTYGFQRKAHELSLTFISNATGSHKAVIQREVSNLIKMNILTEISAPTFNKPRVIGFNKNYSSWELTKQLTVNQIDNHTVNQSVNSTVNQSVNQERKIKENLKESIYIQYAENVKMKEIEFNTLVEKYSEDTTKEMIEVLDNYKGSSGKKYKSDYRAILSWVVDKVTKEGGSGKLSGNSGKNKKQDSEGWDLSHIIRKA